MQASKRISSVRAVKEIDKVLNSLKNGADVYKVLAALAVLRGTFCVEDCS